jgi:methylamine dehydrogenase heavy chain
LFDAAADPVAERPVRIGDLWYFVSVEGRIHPFKYGKQGLEAGDPWWLTTKAERAQGWRPGGVQQLAAHAGRNRLYVIMHRGSRDTHKDPGKDVWVYDLATRKRLQKIAIQHLATSIKLSSDDRPLLYTAFADSAVLDVYNPRTGKLLRSVTDVATTPVLLVTP